MDTGALFDVLLAMLGGAIRVGTPFLFVSLGECLTEKSGRINLGLEGVLVFSAMAGFGGSYLSGSAWAGVLAAAASGGLLAALHGMVCSLPRVNDIAMGIALMLLGAGLAFYLGKGLIQPQAAQVLVSARIHGTNTPLKIYEQLASGRPLVATRIWSHTQVLSESVCFLADPDIGDQSAERGAAVDVHVVQAHDHVAAPHARQ